MNTIDINRISPRVFHFFTWTNNKKAKLRCNKFSQTYRFVYITKGSCNFFIDDDRYSCNSGSLLFLSPGTKYSSIPTSEETFVFNIFFNIIHGNDSIDEVAFDDLHLFTEYKMIDKWTFTDYPIFNEPHLFISESAAHVCNKILREVNIINELYMDFLNVYIHQMLLCLARESSSSDIYGKTDITQKIINYIAKNIHKDIDVSTLSRVFSYHPNYIAKIMKKATGTSLHKYILDEKLKMAEHLICHTDESITNIAFELSFSNSSHFTQTFKQKYGLTPSEYRNKYS